MVLIDIQQFQTELAPVSIYIGSVAEMECTPPSGKPLPKVLWLKDGKTFSDPRVSQSNTLKINDVKITDNANYTCVAMGFKNRTTTAQLKVYTCKKLLLLYCSICAVVNILWSKTCLDSLVYVAKILEKYFCCTFVI